MSAVLRGKWKCFASKIEPLQRSSQCLSIIKNNAFIFGGELQPRQPRDNVVYALNLGDTTAVNEKKVEAITASSAPPARVGGTSTTLGDRVYYFGGRGGVSMNCLASGGSFDVFGTHKSLWSVISPKDQHEADVVPEDRSYHSMTSDHDHTIYLHAGCPAKGRLNDLWAFDTLTQKWKQLESAPGSGRGGTSLAFSDDKLYRINGFDGKIEQGGTLDVYDVKQGGWSSIEYKPDGVNGPEPRSVAALVPIKTREGRELLVTLFGEGAPSDLGHAGAGKMYADVWAWDVSVKRWFRVEFEDESTFPLPRGWFDADAWASGGENGDRLIVHGGLHGDNTRLDDVWFLEIL